MSHKGILERSAAAPILPVSLASLKAHLRLTTGDQDLPLRTYLRSSIAAVEFWTRRSIMDTEWDYLLEAFADPIVLPQGKLRSVTSVTYLPEDGTAAVTVATTVYGVQTADEPGDVYLKPSQSWPSAQLWPSRPITVKFKAGYSGLLAASPLTAGAGTDENILSFASAHNLSDGDTIVNTTVDSEQRVVYVKNSTDLLLEAPISSQASGNSIDAYDTSLIPPDLLRIALVYAADRYRYRESVIPDTRGVHPIPEQIQHLLLGYSA